MRNALVHLRPLGSLRVTLGVLLLLAVAAAVGTVLPAGVDPQQWRQQFGTEAPWWETLGMRGYFSSWGFRGLWAALVVNLLACGLRRSWHGVRDFVGRGRPALRLPVESREAVAGALRDAGFRLGGGSVLRGSRRRWGFLGFPLVHLSPVAIVAGALWGSWGGFVGTTYGIPHTPVWSFFNWSAGQDQELPFVLVVEALRRQFYPMQVRVGIGEREAGGRVVETRVGARFDATPEPYEVEVLALEPVAKELRFYLHGAQGKSGPFSSVKGDAPLRVVPVAFKDPELSGVEAEVTVRDRDNQVLLRHTLAVNHPVETGGLRVYLTAWSEDLDADPWVGLQVVSDPGQSLLWSGAVALAAGMLVLLFVRGGWVREEGGEILLRADREVLRRVRAALAAGNA